MTRSLSLLLPTLIGLPLRADGFPNPRLLHRVAVSAGGDATPELSHLHSSRTSEKLVSSSETSLEEKELLLCALVDPSTSSEDQKPIGVFARPDNRRVMRPLEDATWLQATLACKGPLQAGCVRTAQTLNRVTTSKKDETEKSSSTRSPGMVSCADFPASACPCVPDTESAEPEIPNMRTMLGLVFPHCGGSLTGSSHGGTTATKATSHQHPRFLMIGLGAGVLHAYLLARCRNKPSITTVEVDPLVAAAAQKVFGYSARTKTNSDQSSEIGDLKMAGGSIDGGAPTKSKAGLDEEEPQQLLFVQDGPAWVRAYADAPEQAENQQKKNVNDGRDGFDSLIDTADAERRGNFDVIVVDCFGRGGHLPPVCKTTQFIRDLHSIVKRDTGRIYHNVWGMVHKGERKQLLQKYKEVFVGTGNSTGIGSDQFAKNAPHGERSGVVRLVPVDLEPLNSIVDAEGLVELEAGHERGRRGESGGISSSRLEREEGDGIIVAGGR